MMRQLLLCPPIVCVYRGSSRCPSRRDPGRIRNARATTGNKEFRRKPDIFFLWSTGDGRHVDRSRHEFRMHLSGPRATHLSVVQILISRPFEEHSSYSDIVDAHPSRLSSSPCLYLYLRTGWAGWQFYYDVVAYFPVNHHFSRSPACRGACFAARFCPIDASVEFKTK